MMIPAIALAGSVNASTNTGGISRNDKFIICLDAGHGGKDPGAVGSKPTNREKDINLAIVKEIKRLLSVNCSDVKIVCTRETDVFIELGRRAEIANKAKSDLFISVHVNAIPRTAARKPRGVQTYTLTLRTAGVNLEVEKRENSVISLEKDGKYKEMYNNSNSAESIAMWELMQQQNMAEGVYFAKLAQNEMINTGGRADMGVMQANLAVLRLTAMPSVLLEVGYISTPEEEEFLMTTEGRNIMARSIYNAIIQYKAKVTGRQSALETVSDEERKNAESGAKAAAATSTSTTAKTNTNTASSSESAKTTTAANAPVFKIQILAGSFDLKPNDRQFKGHQTEKLKDGKLYKYFIGASNDYNEIVKQKKELKNDFPSCYIVAFKNGKTMDVNEAINEWKKNKK